MSPRAPEVPKFSLDSIKSEVAELIESRFSHHPGKLDMESIPATKTEVEQMWQWALSNCLENFGAFEDAMSSKSSGLFHTRISSLVNIHRLLPRRVVVDVLESDIPLNSKEGFVRQVIGWREFVRLVHLATDGFRKLPKTKVMVQKSPGDAGFKSWSGRSWAEVAEDNLKKLCEDDLEVTPGEKNSKRFCISSIEKNDSIDGGAMPEHFGAANKLPPAFWGKRSGLNCLDVVVGDVWEEGWSHHITRLMVLSNIATLLDISSRELTDWFWVAYTDAYDWVVEPNVLAMGTHSVGDLMTTKPYVSGSNYINKMSDYCKGCKFNPKKDCPIGNLYWAFLDRHKSKLKDNLRVALPLKTLSRRADKAKAKDQAIYKWVLNELEDGNVLSPDDLPD